MNKIKINKLNRNSSQAEKLEAAKLLFDQMKILGEKKTLKDVQAVVEISLKQGSNSHILILYSERSNPAAVCFFNICAGVQSGGRYIWINEIYVKEKYRKRGYGTALLGYVQKFAERKNCIYILAQRDVKNSESKALFNSDNFDQNTVIWMSKLV